VPDFETSVDNSLRTKEFENPLFYIRFFGEFKLSGERMKEYKKLHEANCPSRKIRSELIKKDPDSPPYCCRCIFIMIANKVKTEAKAKYSYTIWIMTIIAVHGSLDYFDEMKGLLNN
jgi:hypothetical protein